jgi:PAS domain S-box-containing protein
MRILRQSKNKMENIQNSTRDKSSLAEMLNDFSIDRVMAIDLEWNIIAWNRASELASGLSRDLVLGKNLLEVFGSLKADKEMMHAIHGAFLGNKTFVLSDRTKLHRYYYENHFIPLRENGKKVIGVMNIMHDVAHRIKAENELKELNIALDEKYQQLEKLSQELANFTYITTHNIKEPLKFIYASLELLISAEGRHLADSSKANLRRMQVSLNRINRLIDDIVELFKINTVTQKPIAVNLNDVIEKALNHLGRKITERNVTITVQPSMPKVNGIAEMLQLLFQNLVDNAIKFQPEGKSPEITISGKEIRLNELTHQPDIKGSLYVQVAVADNGIGIPAADIKRIFGMFEQLHEKKKYPGSGLGLSFSQKIMDTHNGFIEVESEPDNGSTFYCYFPFDPEIN